MIRRRLASQAPAAGALGASARRVLLGACAARLRLFATLLAFLVAAAHLAPAEAARRGPRRRTVVYTVRKGDTLGKIAKRFRVSVPQLRRWNGLKADRIRAGRRLRVATPVETRSPRMKDAVRLPEGDGWLLKNPDESWGTPRTVAVLQQSLTVWRARHPDAPPIVVGDLSRRHGGWFPPHRSHRDGRDIDIGLPARDKRPLRHFARLGRELDADSTWDLIEAFLQTGEVELVLLDIRLQRFVRRAAEERGYAEADLARIFQFPRSARTRGALVRHARGHADHLHVRIRRPEDAPAIALYGPPAPPTLNPAVPVPPAPDGPGFTSAP